MKRKKNVLMYILFAVTAFCLVAGSVFSKVGDVFNVRGSEFIAVLSAAISWYLCVSKEEFSRDSAKILASFITPLSMIGMAFLQISSRSYIVFIFAVASLVCNLLLTVSKGDKDLETMSLIISGLLVIPTLLLLLFGLVFDDFGSENTVKTVESPSGEYYAEVIDCNEGALGGSTFVEIHKNEEDSRPFFFGKEEKSKRVYSGRWGEFENMEIYWKDDNTLVINSKEYDNEYCK